MNETTYHPRLHLLAKATPWVALVTIIAGALVTSKNAGMAFRDWPTSDGQAMLSYPWWSDFAKNWDKFLEHGHRLAGVMIGLWSILLVTVVCWHEERGWVKGLAMGVLAGVICQGILGGFRVWFDERGLAMLHGAFAAILFSTMTCLATVLSADWLNASHRAGQGEGVDNTNQSTSQVAGRPPLGIALPVAGVTLLVLIGQYILGGFIRHRGLALHEHLVTGIVAFVAVVWNTVVAHRSGRSWLRGSGWMLCFAVFGQVLLGLTTWVAKWGFPETGYVAVADSIGQVTARTSHMILGALVISAAAVHLVRVLRVAYFEPVNHETPISFRQSIIEGGAA